MISNVSNKGGEPSSWLIARRFPDVASALKVYEADGTMKPDFNAPFARRLRINLSLSLRDWRLLAASIEGVIDKADRGERVPGAPGEYTAEELRTARDGLLAALARAADAYNRKVRQRGDHPTNWHRQGQARSRAGRVQGEDEGKTRS